MQISCAILTQIEYNGFMTEPWNSGHAFYAAQQSDYVFTEPTIA